MCTCAYMCDAGTGILKNSLWKPGDSFAVRDMPIEKLTFLQTMADAEDDSSDDVCQLIQSR